MCLTYIYLQLLKIGKSNFFSNSQWWNGTLDYENKASFHGQWFQDSIVLHTQIREAVHTGLRFQLVGPSPSVTTNITTNQQEIIVCLKRGCSTGERIKTNVPPLYISQITGFPHALKSTPTHCPPLPAPTPRKKKHKPGSQRPARAPQVSGACVDAWMPSMDG